MLSEYCSVYLSGPITRVWGGTIGLTEQWQMGSAWETLRNDTLTDTKVHVQ